jgi:ornithine--oxo-acid transaminase
MLRSRVHFAVKAMSSAGLMAREAKHSAPNYTPMPVVFAKSKGVIITDPEGKTYMDFLSGIGAVSQGHLHPKLIKAVTEQLKRCTLSSRAFYNDQFPAYAERVTKLFGYEKVLPMNTGAEGVETAMKMCRRWGYEVKGIKEDQAIIVCCNGNYHGRTFGAISMSADPTSYKNFGPMLPGIVLIDFGDANALAAVLKKHGKNVCGFIVEPIQGEAGVILPPAGYFRQVRKLCTQHNVVWVDDEVQAGIGRTGKMLAIEHEGVRPDAVVLAKALGGGVMPVAAVLADAKFLNVFAPGTHGSTFGGGPVASALAVAALDVIVNEKLVQNAAVMGSLLRHRLLALQLKYRFIREVRCRGLFAAIELDAAVLGGVGANRLLVVLKEHGVLANAKRGHTLRMLPPLVIKPAQVKWACGQLDKALAIIQREDKKGAQRKNAKAAPKAKKGGKAKAAAAKASKKN